MTPLAANIAAFRQLGVRRGTAAAGRRLARSVRGRARRTQLWWRPIAVGESDVRQALGGDTRRALARAGRALPTVERWIEQLDRASPAEVNEVVRRADVAAAHTFDLLGSGPVQLGPQIDWRRDFKSGRQWPMDHISRITVSYPDASDIKVPWELSRCQHLPLLAAAYRVTDDPSYLDELGAQLLHWIGSNPVEFGPNWACTMDVAIRALNWIAALIICLDAAPTTHWIDSTLASLLLHGRFIRSHMEYGPARGNHYLSDVVGLLAVGALFSGSPTGVAWGDWATDKLNREMLHQVREDGCDHEASTSYHRLVTELFIVGADAADVVVPGALDPVVHQRIDKMLGFVADYLRPCGLAPQIGDADDGRLLPLADYGASDQRDHRHLFRQAGRPVPPARGSVAFRAGGFYVMRSNELHAVVRCGDVGIYGRGCHSHNDQLSFDLAYGPTSVIVDPGSFLYTADPQARNLFRSTRFHSTLAIDREEQNELREDRLFALVDRSQAELVEWSADGKRTVFHGLHRGYSALPAPAMHERRFELQGRELRILDVITSSGEHEIEWTFPLAACQLELIDCAAVATFCGVRMTLVAPDLEMRISPGWLSPSYGRRQPTQWLRLTGKSAAGRYSAEILLRLEST